MIPPPTLENRLVRASIGRILPSLYAPTINMGAERKSGVTRISDAKAITVRKRSGERHGPVRCRILVEERKQESLNVEGGLA
jgi:hypothetical protein